MQAQVPKLTWLVGDVMDMKGIPDASFDVALDKGTLDALMVCLHLQTIAYFDSISVTKVRERRCVGT